MIQNINHNLFSLNELNSLQNLQIIEDDLLELLVDCNLHEIDKSNLKSLDLALENLKQNIHKKLSELENCKETLYENMSNSEINMKPNIGNNTNVSIHHNKDDYIQILNTIILKINDIQDYISILVDLLSHDTSTFRDQSEVITNFIKLSFSFRRKLLKLGFKEKEDKKQTEYLERKLAIANRYLAEEKYNPSIKDAFLNSSKIQLPQSNILAKFTPFSQVLSKKELNNRQLEQTEGDRLRIQDNVVFKHILRERAKNSWRNKLSLISSTVFLKHPDFLEKLSEQLFSNDSFKILNNIEELDQINIKNIFIISDTIGQIKFSSFAIPRFTSYYMDTKDNSTVKINFIFISLDHFCLLCSNINYNNIKQQTYVSKYKNTIFSEIPINDNFRVNKVELFNYFYNINFNESIFIFIGYSWSKVVANFKFYDIELSGGSVVKRHLVSPLDFTLSSFLIKMFKFKDAYKYIVKSNYSFAKEIYESKVSDSSFNEGTKENFTDDFLLLIESGIEYILFEIFKSIAKFNKDSISMEEIENNKLIIADMMYLILNEIIITRKPLNNNYNYLVKDVVDEEDLFYKEIKSLYESNISSFDIREREISIKSNTNKSLEPLSRLYPYLFNLKKPTN